MLERTHEDYMRMALAEAGEALEHEDVPVGAVIVGPRREGGPMEVLARAHNQRELLQDPTAHAEMVALTQAAAAVGSWRLTGSVMYVTLEPCVMCAGALVLARVETLVFGAEDPKAGAVRNLYRVCEDPRLNHRLQVVGGVLSDECAEVLREFFRRKRGKNEG